MLNSISCAGLAVRTSRQCMQSATHRATLCYYFSLCASGRPAVADNYLCLCIQTRGWTRRKERERRLFAPSSAAGRSARSRLQRSCSSHAARTAKELESWVESEWVTHEGNSRKSCELDNLVGVQANPQRTENQPRPKNGFRIKCFREDWQITCDFLQLFILRCAYAIHGIMHNWKNDFRCKYHAYKDFKICLFGEKHSIRKFAWKLNNFSMTSALGYLEMSFDETNFKIYLIN